MPSRKSKRTSRKSSWRTSRKTSRRSSKRTSKRSHVRSNRRTHVRSSLRTSRRTTARDVSVSEPDINIRFLGLKKDKYIFDKKFPNNISEKFYNKHDLLLAKLWYIKRIIRYKTHINMPTYPITKDYIKPEGFCAFGPMTTQDKLDLAYNDIHALFTDVTQKIDSKKSNDIIVSDQRDGRGLLYLFTGPEGVTQYYLKTMQQLREYNCNNLAEMIDTYLSKLCKIYDVPDTDEFKNTHVQIVLLQYQPKVGIWLHIDNVARYDQGPIITVSLGHPRVYYDIAPVLIKNPKARPLRINGSEGSVFIMDGAMRMQWSHGLPYDVESPSGKLKYTIMFKCDKFRELNPVYDKTLDHQITSSGIIC